MSGVLLMACLHGQRNSARVGRGPPLHEPRVARQGEARGDRRRGGRGGEGRARRSELMVRMTLWNYTSLTDSALLRSGSETWGPVLPDNVHETGVSPGGRSVPHCGRGGGAGRANSKKPGHAPDSRFLCPTSAPERCLGGAAPPVRVPPRRPLQRAGTQVRPLLGRRLVRTRARMKWLRTSRPFFLPVFHAGR